MIPSGFTIKFHFQKNIVLPARKALKSFIADQLNRHGKSGATVNFIFCSDDALLEINRQYLNHDYYTDIITFDLSDKNASFLVSDIYISVDRVKENAALEKAPVSEELHRVCFHGLLHLLGYKDKSNKDRAEMRHMETQWLKKYYTAGAASRKT